jgi:CDP-glucose 4,6-dehydratase
VTERGAAQPLPGREFWAGCRVLLTGHSGFKGAWLASWLRELGADVLGLSLPEPPSEPSLWEQLALADVADVRADVVNGGWQDRVTAFAPQVVFHLAAQPLVSVGYEQPGRTYDVNVLGTVRVIEAALDAGAEVVLVITTDKVYDPAAPGPHGEEARLGGREPYSASKAAAEIVVAGWPRGPMRIATARAGNVIGGGDWARDRLLPDLVRGWTAGAAAVLRDPRGVRPWQHVLEPLRGYLLYVEELAGGVDPPSTLNFGPAQPQVVPVERVVEHAAATWAGLGQALPDPAWTAQESRAYAETAELTLDSSCAAAAMGWASVLGWQEAVDLTMVWYAGQQAGRPAADLIAEQLRTYWSLVETLA